MHAPRTATCPTCNVAVADGDRFCKNCGTEVSGVNASIVAAAGGNWTSPDTGSLSANSPWELVLMRLREVTVGEFDVGRELGRGGMAAVFLAQDLALNRKVAIKVMAPGLMMGDGMVQRFRQEAITIANLSHAHIVTIHAVRQLADLHFFVMQFVEGQSLETVLRTHGTLPVPIVKAMLHQVGSALAYAHRRGVVHRDIKPGNILLSADGDALVTDFGIAKVAEGPNQTQTGMVVGTPTYMSPEQCFATEVDGASDQYSLGIVAYQMLTGRVPFTGSAFAIMKGHTTEPVPSIRDSVPDVPPEVDAAILRMLAKTPAERFASFADALAAMGAGAVGENSTLRSELIRLAAVEERREQLGELLRTPSSPVPKSRSGRRSSAEATPRTPAPPPTAIAIAIAPLANELEVGDRIELRASVRGTSAADALRWTTEAPDVATVDEVSGVLTALSAGEAVVVARLHEAEERLSLAVREARVSAIRVDVPASDLHVGDSCTLVAHPLDKRGALLDRPVEWSVVGASAEITQDGVLQVRGAGRAAVSVMCEDVYETVVLQVAPARVATIELEPPAEALEVGHSVALGARARDARGGVLPDRPVRWTVSPAGRARIDAAGVLSALQAGEVRVTATSEDVSATLLLIIPPARAATIGIIDVPDFIRDGDRFVLTVLTRDVRGTAITRIVKWRSSDAAIASVDQEGAVHAIKAGSVDIAASVDGVSTSARLLVHATPEAFAAMQRGASDPVAPASATEVLSSLVQGEAAAPSRVQAVARPEKQSVQQSEQQSEKRSKKQSEQQPAAANHVPAADRSRWMYAAAAVPVLGLVLWLASGIGNDDAAADGASSGDVAPSVPGVDVTTGSDANVAQPVDEAGKPVASQAALADSNSAADSARMSASADAGSSGSTETPRSTPPRAEAPAPRAQPPAPSVAQRTQAESVQTARGEQAVTPPPTVTPPTRSESTATAPAITQAQLASEARATVEAYARAFEAESLDRIRSVFPSIPANFASGLSEFFAMANEVRVTINGFSPAGTFSAESGSRMRVSVPVSIRYNDGRGRTQSDTWSVTLLREDTRWRIAGIGDP